MQRFLFFFGFLTTLLLPHIGWAAPVGFQAGLKQDIAVKATGWKQVTGMQTSNEFGLFQLGTAFNETTATFTAPAKGHYIVTGMIRFGNANDGPANRYIRAQIGINSNHTDINNGMMTIQGEPRLKVLTLHVSGVVALNQGDKVTLWSYSNNDNDYTIQKGTRFSVMQIDPALSHGFHADLNSSLAVTAAGWKQTTSWRTTGTPGLFSLGGGFDANKGEYTAPVSGYYHFSARLRVDLFNAGYYQAHIAIQGRDSNNGLISTGRHTRNPYSTVELSGVVFMNKGEKATLWLFSSEDNSFSIQSESGFSGALISTAQKAGFHADLNAKQSMSYNAWTLLKGWRTSGSKGLFAGTGFNATQGTYTVPTSGYYYISSQVRLDNLNQISTVYPNQASLGIDVSSQIYQQAMHVDPQSNLYSMRVEGFFYLLKGDILSVQVQGTFDGAFDANTESGLSVILMGYADEDKDGVTNDKDCDDKDKTVYPGAPELCDGKDNDCNQKTDDVQGPCTVPNVKGVCATGEWSCGRGLQKYCKSKTLSQIEVCDGQDNSCDGNIDNVPGLGESCKVPGKSGLCETGVLKCDLQKKATVCEQTIQPVDEICDGKDNDCDGKVDNLKDLGQPCTDSNRKGACGPGTWLCLNNKKICQAFAVPTKESCDGQDSDCNGKVDDIAESGKPCIIQSQKGECRVGAWACANNAKECQATTQSTTETCDNKDNDCDGKIDNIADFGKPCTDSNRKGECQPGTWVCGNNTKVCQATVQPTAEVCDQKDNDCDGQVDNGVCNKPNECPNGCPAGQTCQNGTCQTSATNPCANVNCLPGEFCREGSCFPSCGCLTCAKGNVCVDGACRADLCGGVTCPVDQVCSPSTGACEPDPCKGVTCNADTVCEAGVCVQDPCSVVKCGTNQVCVKGQCYDQGCEPGAPPKPLPDGGTLPPPPTAGCNASIQWEPSLFAFLLSLLLLLAFTWRRTSRERSHL
ncbi:MAG: hypothetical protein EP343_21850 [Deltaproteobacteria bacterium]|nr:MAG: hypothetical protein EP343_21850 [Deltaproteobacteria bacterium]